MYCPKCGSQNGDATRYCRGCGADLNNVLAVVAGNATAVSPLAEKHIALYSSAVRWLVMGLGFLFVSGLSFAISMRLAVLGIFAMAFGFLFLGPGIARLVQARALKNIRESKPDRPSPALSPGEADYVKPHALYESEELLTRSRSITEHTTTHLEIDPDAEEAFGESKK